MICPRCKKCKGKGEWSPCQWKKWNPEAAWFKYCRSCEAGPSLQSAPQSQADEPKEHRPPPHTRFLEERQGELQDPSSPDQFALGIAFMAGAERTGEDMFAGQSCAALVRTVRFLIFSLAQCRQWMHQACDMCRPIDETHSKYHDWTTWPHEARMMIMQYDWSLWSHCTFAAALGLSVPSLVNEHETIETKGKRGEAMTYVALTSQDAKLRKVIMQYLALTACIARLNQRMRCQCGNEIVEACSSVDSLRTALLSRGLLPRNRWSRQRPVQNHESREVGSIFV